jgi:hypothetical protein
LSGTNTLDYLLVALECRVSKLFLLLLLQSAITTTKKKVLYAPGTCLSHLTTFLWQMHLMLSLLMSLVSVIPGTDTSRPSGWLQLRSAPFRLAPPALTSSVKMGNNSQGRMFSRLFRLLLNIIFISLVSSRIYLVRKTSSSPSCHALPE